ncbi:MAG: hypothetical protein EXR51_06955 [Dehalococcoidia bacterium]|nr:hypothetical protein [Dehalococcoidia bacterium]
MSHSPHPRGNRSGDIHRPDRVSGPGAGQRNGEGSERRSDHRGNHRPGDRRRRHRLRQHPERAPPVRQYERAGVAAIHIEDQEFPKCCGHLDNKRVVSIEEMVPKIRAAVDARADDDFTLIVRTDALAVTG